MELESFKHEFAKFHLLSSKVFQDLFAKLRHIKNDICIPMSHYMWILSYRGKTLSIFAKSSITDVRLCSKYVSELHKTMQQLVCFLQKEKNEPSNIH